MQAKQQEKAAELELRKQESQAKIAMMREENGAKLDLERARAEEESILARERMDREMQLQLVLMVCKRELTPRQILQPFFLCPTSFYSVTSTTST